MPDEINQQNQKYGVILYARTSSSENKHLLDTQIQRLEEYAISKGYKIKESIKEIGSGLNDERKKLSKVLKENKYDKIINNGLIPKSYKKKAYHPERIYFYQSNLLNNPYTDLRLQAKYLYKKGDTFVDTVKKYVTDKGLSIIILKIDLYKYDKVKYRFFQDSNHP